MRKAYMVYISNMIDDLKTSETQTTYVVKSYKNVYRNRYETISVDVQMQTMCKYILERFNLKLKKANQDDLAKYQYLLYFFIICSSYSQYL